MKKYNTIIIIMLTAYGFLALLSYLLLQDKEKQADRLYLIEVNKIMQSFWQMGMQTPLRSSIKKEIKPSGKSSRFFGMKALPDMFVLIIFIQAAGRMLF